jgi:hypothetical protein
MAARSSKGEEVDKVPRPRNRQEKISFERAIVADSKLGRERRGKKKTKRERDRGRDR